MVELNEKALEAAHHTYQTHGQMGDLKAQRLSDSYLTAVITAYLAALPEEVVFCPQCGWNSAMDGPALPAPDDGLEGIDIEQLARTIVLTCQYSWPKDRVKAFERAERLISSALQSKDEQIEKLTREIEAISRHASECQSSTVQAYSDLESLEQQVQKLTAENEKLRELVRKCAAALPNGAHINPKASLDFMAKLPAEIRSVCSDLETQEGGK